MADPTPDDGFERYFAEKLWERVPAVYRQEDGAAERPGVLRAVIEVIAGQAARLRRSHDRQWEDRFIDLCDSWAVPYLGALVGTRLVSALDPTARRIDVAKTIYYRRRKGTPRVLEELIADIARWEGVVVEAFRGLVRAPHGLEPPPARGRFSATPRGGLADLRRPFASTLAGGPFDEYAHTPDMRRSRGSDGRWAIRKVAFHLFRLRSLPVAGVTPFARPGGGFTFDPSGRDIPLFAPRTRAADFDDWRAALPWELPAPISCRLLDDAAFLLDDRAIAGLPVTVPAPALADLATIRHVRYASEARFVDQLGRLPQAATLVSATVLPAILEAALQPGGHAALLPIVPPSGPTVRPAFATVPAVRPSLIVGANLDTWSATAPGKRLAVSPERGRIVALDPAASPTQVSYHYGTPGPIGAGSYARGASIAAAATPVVAAGGGPLVLPAGGTIDVSDSRTYGPIGDPGAFTALVVQALDRERPYLRLAGDLIFTAAPTGGELVLEGLWLGSAGPCRVVLAGPFRKVAIRHCTFDPGGSDVTGAAIGPVALHVTGAVDELAIDASILGPIDVASGAVIDALTIRDSILQSRSATPALASPLGEVRLARTTVLGDLRAERLWADDTLVAGVVDASDTQDGCFRFSAAFAASRLPHPFASVVLPDARGLFRSTRFGDPGYAQLADGAADRVARGAETGSEIGAFSALDNPIKADSLAHKVDEFLPFGLAPIFVNAD
ncbi:MAG TPA: hypothetical protein VGD37_23730 [Kofleriaceae bacterium]|jgi:hypothetical protein